MENIVAGDLVIVVRSTLCCRNSESVGTTFQVSEIADQSRMINHLCAHCGHNNRKFPTALTGSRDIHTGRWIAFELKRLKKIPPLSELEKIETQKEINT